MLHDVCESILNMKLWLVSIILFITKNVHHNEAAVNGHADEEAAGGEVPEACGEDRPDAA